MMIKIWQRYLLKEFLKVFCFFLFGFYFIYVLIDYSTHMQDFLHNKKLSVSHLCAYYAFHFFKRANLLVPIAILIATIKLLCSMNVHLELVAFQTAGMRLKKLLSPVIALGLICTLFNFALEEFVLPLSLNYIDRFYDTHLRHSYRGNRLEPIHVLYLDDHSRLIYQYYDNSKESFFDVMWIRNANDLWRMKYLKADPKEPIGKFADHLMRTQDTCFEKIDSFETILLQDLKWEKDLPRKGFVPFENRSISDLIRLLNQKKNLSPYETSEIKTQLYLKFMMPFCCLLFAIAIAPYCIRYSRNFPTFFTYAIALFGAITFFTLIDGFAILGSNATLAPFSAVFFPFLASFSLFGWNYVRIK